MYTTGHRGIERYSSQCQPLTKRLSSFLTLILDIHWQGHRRGHRRGHRQGHPTGNVWGVIMDQDPASGLTRENMLT